MMTDEQKSMENWVRAAAHPNWQIESQPENNTITVRTPGKAPLANCFAEAGIAVEWKEAGMETNHNSPVGSVIHFDKATLDMRQPNLKKKLQSMYERHTLSQYTHEERQGLRELIHTIRQELPKIIDPDGADRTPKELSRDAVVSVLWEVMDYARSQDIGSQEFQALLRDAKRIHQSAHMESAAR